MVTLCHAERRYIQKTSEYGGRYQKLDRFKIYHKARYRCYICDVRVEVTPKLVDNQASLDHIIPLSKGGDHTYENTRCCCRKCNLEKGDGSRKG